MFRISLRLVVLLSSSVEHSLYQQRNRHGVMEWKFYVTDDLRDFFPPLRLHLFNFQESNRRIADIRLFHGFVRKRVFECQAVCPVNCTCCCAALKQWRSLNFVRRWREREWFVCLIKFKYFYCRISSANVFRYYTVGQVFDASLLPICFETTSFFGLYL